MTPTPWNLRGKVVVVTGAASGIGEATARALLKEGAEVVVVARTLISSEQAIARIRSEVPNAVLYAEAADLSSLSEVRALAHRLMGRHPRIEGLMNIAGVMPLSYEKSSDGIELNRAVNFYAPVLLCRLLLPRLRASAPARVVNVSSSLHREGKIVFDDPKGEGPYERYAAYSTSKLSLLLYTRALAKELSGTGVMVNAAHPGWIRTKLAVEAMRKSFFLARWYAVLFKMRPPEEAAMRLARMMSDPLYTEVSGAYFGASGKGPGLPSETAQDDVLAARLLKETDSFLAPYLA